MFIIFLESELTDNDKYSRANNIILNIVTLISLYKMRNGKKTQSRDGTKILTHASSK